MNTTIEKMFEEIGRLHIQISQYAAYVVQLEAKVVALQSAAAVAPTPTA
jgi:hypothetical protein